MEAVRVEMINSNGKKSIVIPAGVYEFFCSEVYHIKTLDRICKICLCDELIVVKMEDRDFRDGRQISPPIKDDRTINNVDAYNWKGEHLWNIGDIIGDIKAKIDNISYIDTTEAKREFGVHAEKNARLFHCTALGWTFIIDAVNRKQLCKVGGRVK